MSRNKSFGTLGAVLLMVTTVTFLVPGVCAQSTYKTLYKFKGGKDGRAPQAGLTFDPAENLYGTTYSGGAVGNWGTVFELVANPDGSWTEKVIHQFTGGDDGCLPMGGLVIDTAGNLYGTASSCGAHNFGNVFELTPNQDGSWTEKVLHQFTGVTDGSRPYAGLVFDPSDNLYGTTFRGGVTEDGTVFELIPNQDGSWTEKVLHNFCSVQNCDDGANPIAGVILDSAGNLYGTTWIGGNGLGGVAFKLAPNQDGSWAETVLHNFKGRNDGLSVVSGLSLDPTGNLYGTMRYGGLPGGGVVFKLIAKAGGSWTEQQLYRFTGSHNGGNPYAGVILDGAGNVYGTAQIGGALHHCAFGCGVVFKVTPNSKGGWKGTTLHSFLDHPGAEPVAGLIFDAAGNLYGTTEGDGITTFGSVFEIMP
jgi:hypothetical protein